MGISRKIKALAQNGLAGYKAEPAYASLVCMAFCMGFSMPLARAFLVVSLALAVRDIARGKARLRIRAPAIMWLAYFAAAVIISAIAVANFDAARDLTDPARGIRKVTKLLWFAGAVVVPTVVRDARQFMQLLTAFAAGSLLFAARCFMNVPLAWIQLAMPMPGDGNEPSGASAALLQATDSLGLTGGIRKWVEAVWRFEPFSNGARQLAERRGDPDLYAQLIRDFWASRSYNAALAHMSDMSGPQRLMAGVVTSACLALAAIRGKMRARAKWLSLLAAALGVALALCLKRGALAACIAVLLPIFIANIGWKKSLLALAVAAACLFAVPASRARMAALPRELDADKGGRASMWTHVVPGIRADYPMGVGFRGLTTPAMRHYFWRTEMDQNHVHCNILQVLVELGWAGLAVYIAWMFAAMRAGFRARFARVPENGAVWDERDNSARAIPLALIAAIFVNGLVEYNLVSGDVTLVMGLAMGLASCEIIADSRKGGRKPSPATEPQNPGDEATGGRRMAADPASTQASAASA